MADEKRRDSEQLQMNQAYMNRLFCTTTERIGYVAYSAFGKLKLLFHDHKLENWYKYHCGILNERSCAGICCAQPGQLASHHNCE